MRRATIPGFDASRKSLNREDSYDQSAVFIRCWEDEPSAFPKTLRAAPADRGDYRAAPQPLSDADVVWLPIVEKTCWNGLLETWQINC